MDDAKATNIEIIFTTGKSAQNSNDNICLSDRRVRIVFKNNDYVFRSEDWNRLKKLLKES